jgi:hypothetical protein
MKYIFIGILATTAAVAQIIDIPKGCYSVEQLPGHGGSAITGGNGTTFITPCYGGTVVTGSGNVQGALVAAELSRSIPTPQIAVNPMPIALDQYQNQQFTVWAQANQTINAALESMPPPASANLQIHPAPTPEKWFMLNTNWQCVSVDPPKGLKHTKEGEALLNPYTHGVETTAHPPTNPGPWQQYLIDCKVPSNRLMRERTILAYLDGFNELECFKISIGYDENNLKKYHTQFMQLINTLNPDQKTQFRTHLCEDFGVKDPKYIQTKELIPYLRLWIRDHPQNVASNVAAHP